MFIKYHLDIRKYLVNVTFPTPLNYLNGSLSKCLSSLKVYFIKSYVIIMLHILLQYCVSLLSMHDLIVQLLLLCPFPIVLMHLSSL